MIKKILIMILIGILAFNLIALASAVTISACGQNITASGNYLLNQSITSTATCLTVNSSNILIDCAGNAITYGTAGGNSAFGIYALGATGQTNLTIKNCIIMKSSSAGSSPKPRAANSACHAPPPARRRCPS